jgi:hypothetical protein
MNRINRMREKSRRTLKDAESQRKLLGFKVNQKKQALKVLTTPNRFDSKVSLPSLRLCERPLLGLNKNTRFSAFDLDLSAVSASLREEDL